ncbi:MAG: hypothetical protein LBI79_06455 [Nitrososphaerota archaeon]|jgi:hypothetical protein|nr:hypothetical protein [Nitrososphaerota archaeon]
MKKTAACLLILMFTMSLCLTAIPKIAGQPSSIKVLDNYSCYCDNYGYLIIVGEVQNTGPNTISMVILGAVLTLSDGTQTDAAARVWVDNLIPQQKAPFYLEFSSPDTSYWLDRTIVVADFIILQADATSNYLYPDVAVISDQGVVAKDGTFWVNGNLKNNGNQEAKNVQVFATFFNDQGQIAAVGHTDIYASNRLAPSEIMSFKVGAFDINQTNALADQKIVSYSLLVQVTDPVLQGEAPVIFETPPPGPIITEAPGDTKNPQTIDPTIIYLAVIIIVVIVVIVVMFLIKKNAANSSVKTKYVSSIQKAKRKK